MPPKQADEATEAGTAPPAGIRIPQLISIAPTLFSDFKLEAGGLG
jgi:hypothetical protein